MAVSAGVRLPVRGCVVAAVLLGVLFSFLTQHHSDAAKGVHYKTLIRMERYGNCPEYPDLPNHFNFSEVVPYGRTLVGRGTYIIVRDYKKLTKAVAHINRCADRNDPNCELYQNWRFGEETCSLLLMKNAIWTPLFTFHPPLECPLKAGVYQMENVTVDIDRLKLVQFPEKGYFKVSVVLDVDKIAKQACFYFEVSFIKIKV